jgi:hypothetical protein
MIARHRVKNSLIENSGRASVRQAHRATRTPLERPVHGTCVRDEILSSPWMSREELSRQQLAFEAIAVATRGDEVAERVRAAVRQRVHVVESGVREIEASGAVDTAPAAVAHRGALNGVFLVGGRQPAVTTRMGGDAWTKDAVIMPSGQFHLE